MADDDKGVERRRYARVELRRVAAGQTAVIDFTGAVRDISTHGVAIEAEAEVPPRVGDAVLLDIEDLEPLTGTVSRILDGGFVVTYDPAPAEEDKLIADIMVIANDLPKEED